VAIIFFTSGTSGEPKGALHSHNTVHAGMAGLGEPGVGQQDVIFTPHALMHTLAYRSTLLSLWNGACRVLLDSWSGERVQRYSPKPAPRSCLPRQRSSRT
jgi:cyclohexanecarboxylate-CoA ligase